MAFSSSLGSAEARAAAPSSWCTCCSRANATSGGTVGNPVDAPGRPCAWLNPAAMAAFSASKSTDTSSGAVVAAGGAGSACGAVGGGDVAGFVAVVASVGEAGAAVLSASDEVVPEAGAVAAGTCGGCSLASDSMAELAGDMVAVEAVGALCGAWAGFAVAAGADPPAPMRPMPEAEAVPPPAAWCRFGGGDVPTAVPPTTKDGAVSAPTTPAPATRVRAPAVPGTMALARRKEPILIAAR